MNLPDMAELIGKSDDQLARYIAGDMEMGAITWLKANEAFPELVDRITETAAERRLRANQRALDLDLTAQRTTAA